MALEEAGNYGTPLEAGRTQYNLSAGANFLEALMSMLDSDDGDAGIQFVVGLMTYLTTWLSQEQCLSSMI